MRRFEITIAACLLMAAALPFPDVFAVSEDSPIYTHFVYLFGHSGVIHYLINAWTLLVVHNLLRWYRLIAAYLWTVGVSYVLLPDQPMVGLSVFNCFFIGFAAPWLWRRDRLAVVLTAGLLLLTCVISGFAGVQHVASFVAGAAFFFGERCVKWLKEGLDG